MAQEEPAESIGCRVSPEPGSISRFGKATYNQVKRKKVTSRLGDLQLEIHAALR
jgi:hypothetical protein